MAEMTNERYVKYRKAFASLFRADEHKVFAQGKGGGKIGKPLSNSAVLAKLEVACPDFTMESPSEQAKFLEKMLVDDLVQVPQDVSYEIRGVDSCMAEFFGMFRWRSDGRSMQCLFWRAEGERVLLSSTRKVKKEVRPMSNQPDGMAAALQADARLWDAALAHYNHCITNNLGITPKSVTQGRSVYHTLRAYLCASFDAWLNDPAYRVDNEPSTITKDTEKWTFLYFNVDKCRKLYDAGEMSPTPAWDGWLAKLGPERNRRIFRAWLYGVFVEENEGRQVMWLGDMGGGGKSSVAFALQEFMQGVGCGAISADMLTSEFGMASAYGKRLLVHADNKNQRLLSSALVHQVTGGDKVLVNQKNEKAFTARVFSKVLVMANCKPQVDMRYLHERSRILYFDINPDAEGADQSHRKVDAEGRVQLVGDNGFGKRLLEEMPDLLIRAAGDYAELCPKGANILISPEAQDEMDIACSSVEMQTMEAFVADHLVIDPDGSIAGTDLFDLAKSCLVGKWSDNRYGDLVKYLETLGCHKARNGKRVIKGIREK